MNEKLRKFLEGLSDQDADEIWSWLDMEQHVSEEMIKVLCDSHPNLQ